MKKIFPSFLLLCFLICQCSKEKDEIEPTQDLIYTSLIAEKDTLLPGEDTKIRATANGSNLNYFWSATKGDILGSGVEVTYASSPCHIGINQITCKITDANNQSDSKTIDIVVLEE